MGVILMMRRIYIDPDTGDYLLMSWNDLREGWMPNVSKVKEILDGTLFLYRVNHSTCITYNSTAPMLTWKVMTTDETFKIKSVIPKPWIPYRLLRELPANAATNTVITDIVDSMLMLMTLSSYYSDDTASTPPSIKPFPKQWLQLVLDATEKRNEECAITSERLTVKNASVTTCGHVFETNAIKKWLQSNPLCPNCREPCVSTSLE